jgi:hypothetical protein
MTSGEEDGNRLKCEWIRFAYSLKFDGLCSAEDSIDQAAVVSITCFRQPGVSS